ncbi:MAG: 3-phosphoshikimate 1-carboxyvinyltransferase [Bacteroidales bacterium]|nr:3-phosphoshikimate 1-carboxyvinyltransferase [Bacteroidales bacterium]
MVTLTAPKNIAGKINLPASKSISNRALIIKALCGDTTPVENLSECDDTHAVTKNMASLASGGKSFDIGAAGTAMRFLTAYLANRKGEWEITGSTRMKQRPIKILADALNLLGANIEYTEKEGFPPLHIYGNPLTGGEIELEGNVSSQYISALLMIAPYMQKGLTVNLKGKVISKPYILLTLKMMEQFGVNYTWTKNKIRIEKQQYTPRPYKVESDWSAASYWYEILAICGEGEIFLTGLTNRSSQGDAKVAELFSMLGIETVYSSEGALLRYTGKLAERMIYNFVEQPDLAQTFTVTCCMLNIPFAFSGLQSLKIKETDRIAALITEMRKTGFVLREDEEGTLIWDGTKVKAEKEITIKTYDDHRMAMAFAPISLKVVNLQIENPEVVSKSYPTFWDDLKSVGFKITNI